MVNLGERSTPTSEGRTSSDSEPRDFPVFTPTHNPQEPVGVGYHNTPSSSTHEDGWGHGVGLSEGTSRGPGPT